MPDFVAATVECNLLIEAKKVSQSILLIAFTAGSSWSQLKTSVIKIGSIEPGKNADLILCNVQDYREIPYLFGVNHVHMVLKDGVISYQEGGPRHWSET